MQLQSFYDILAGQFGTALTPESIAQPQLSNDICVAHILYKCLSKVALWCWSRFRILDSEELKGWVRFLAIERTLLTNPRPGIFHILPSRSYAAEDVI